MAMCESAFSSTRDSVSEADDNTIDGSSTTDNASETDSEATVPELALFNAVANLDLKTAEELIRGGMDVNSTSQEFKYRTALHELVLGYVSEMELERHGVKNIRFIDILTLLIHNGLDVNAVDIYNKSPLHLLVSYPGHGNIMKILLASGVKANLQDNSYQTALHVSVMKGTTKDVETLLDGGVDPDIFDFSGHAALHLAAKSRL